MATNGQDPAEKRHPIQVAARRTGLTTDLLRAWERRYGVVEPGRSEGGRRLYSDDDIETLRLLKWAVDGGRRIGDVAELGREELAELVREDEEAGAERAIHGVGEAERPADPYLDASLQAAARFDEARLEGTLRRAAFQLGMSRAIREVTAPLLERIGTLWAEGEVGVAHEHLASAMVVRVLTDLVGGAESDPDAPRLVVATPSGMRHELGALFVAVTASLEGWRPVYLGPDLPAEEVARAAVGSGAGCVALSLIYPAGSEDVERELSRLRECLPAGFTVIVGGTAASSYADALEAIGALVLEDVDALRGALSSLADRV